MDDEQKLKIYQRASEALIVLVFITVVFTHHALAGAVEGQVGYAGKTDHSGIKVMLKVSRVPIRVQVGLVAVLVSLVLAFYWYKRRRSAVAVVFGILMFVFCLPIVSGSWKYEMVTGSDGRYRFAQTPVASYEIIFLSNHYMPYIVNGINVQRNLTNSVNTVVLRPDR